MTDRMIYADYEALGSSSPRLLECENDWKVSPFGDADPDRDCYWEDTLEDAKDALESERKVHHMRRALGSNWSVDLFDALAKHEAKRLRN